MKIPSFPEGRGTLFTCVPILVYTYKEFVLYMTTYPVCLLYREILCLVPAKHILHSIVVGVEYYNYLFDSGHQESSQSFTMNCMFRPL